MRKAETATGSPRIEAPPPEPKEEVSEITPSLKKSASGPPVKFGTQLSLSENSITKMLWTQDVDVIAMDEKDELNRKQQARTLVCIEYWQGIDCARKFSWIICSISPLRPHGF